MRDTRRVTTLTGHRPDPVCAGAVDEARAAAVEEAGALVGEHLGVEADGERLVTHHFACLDPAYRGWHWAVTVTRVTRARSVTIDEVVLLPGDDALLPPPWLPWSERLRPGDVGVGDLLPTAPDDERLAPTFMSTTDADEHDVVFELGLGRQRVLSYDGRVEAAERWHHGDHGPHAPIAKAAPAPCATCGFYLPLSGALRQAFGVCANEYAPDDGRVVAVDHGCGAHSEAVTVPGVIEPPPPLLDDFGFDVVGGPIGHTAGSVTDTDSAEPLGHS
jgi:hypothetical protein